MNRDVPVQSLIDHIKTATDVDPWAKDMAEELLKEQEVRVMSLDELTEIYVEFKGDICPCRLTNFDLQKIVK